MVGPSGSGKSTIAKLLLRCYDPNKGRISVNEKDLKTINLRSYRHRIGYIGQEPCLLHDTIRNNLLLSNPEASEDELYQALKSARALDFVKKLDEGIDTNVGSVGGKLSGGQKQRIAIARALLRKPDLLIFDEATSALDMKNEREVEKAIQAINEEQSITRVVIAHRISAISNADKIIVLKDGQVEDEGHHEGLINNNEFYSETYKLQSKSHEGKDGVDSHSIESNQVSVSIHHDEVNLEFKEEENNEIEEDVDDKIYPFCTILKRLYSLYNPTYMFWIAIPAVMIVGMGLPMKGIPQSILTISYSKGINSEIQDDMLL